MWAQSKRPRKFGKRIYLEAWKRGWSRAEKKVVMGDGADWIWNLADQYFPGATQVVDLFHARQHLWELARKLHPNDESGQNHWVMIHQDLLDRCKIKKLVSSLRSIQTPSVELAEKLRTEAEYFRRNARRMRYPKFRRQHMFVGTGVIEAGCKTLIGSRCKQSGMFWTVRGANAILALRSPKYGPIGGNRTPRSLASTSQTPGNIGQSPYDEAVIVRRPEDLLRMISLAS